VQIKIDRQKVPKREWHWNQTKEGYYGVNTFDKKLVWFFFKESTKFYMNRKRQSYLHFLKNGPKDLNIPSDVMLEIYELLINAMIE
jgi:hypothetical protein